MRDSIRGCSPDPAPGRGPGGDSGEPTATEGLPADWFLQSLVSLINHRPHLRLDVVLQVRGLEVSGTIVSGTAYFERFARAFPDALALTDQAQRQTAYDSIAMHAARYGLRNADDSVDPPEYVHLIEAQVVSCRPRGNVDARIAVPLWRGRIDAVDGFQLRHRHAAARPDRNDGG